MRILQDVFPAIVAVAPGDLLDDVTKLSSSPITKGANQVTKARVIVSDERILIAVDGDNEGPRVVYSQRVVSHVKSAMKNQDSYVVTDGGHLIAFKKDDNCGCGSRLRSWNPYNVIYSSEDPTE